MRVEGEVLERHGHLEVPRGQLVHHPLFDPDVPFGGPFQAGSGEGWWICRIPMASQHHELTIGDRQVERLNSEDIAGVPLRHLLECDADHGRRLRPT